MRAVPNPGETETPASVRAGPSRIPPAASSVRVSSLPSSALCSTSPVTWSVVVLRHPGRRNSAPACSASSRSRTVAATPSVVVVVA